MYYRILIFVSELALVAMAVFLADELQAVIDIIPRWLIRLPEADYSTAEFWTVWQFFIVVHAVVLGVAGLLCGPWRIADPKRTVDEAFALAFGFAVSALLIFITTTVSFDPQFVVGIVVCAELLVLLLHIVARVRTGTSPGAIASAFFKSFLHRSFSIPGVLIFAVALSPGVLAKLFVSDRDIANVITQIRITIASVKPRDWDFINAFGSQTFAQPILVRFPPNNPDKVYVLERGGRLLRLPWNRPGKPEVVLDIREKIGYVEVENGALGFDFHPRFGQPGANERDDVYVYPMVA